MITHAGQTKCLSEWAEDAGMGEAALRRRLDIYGIPFSIAIATPVKRGGVRIPMPKAEVADADHLFDYEDERRPDTYTTTDSKGVQYTKSKPAPKDRPND